MINNQLGVVLQMKAKPGKGQALFDLAIDLHHLNDPDGPTDWIVSRSEDDPDVMWAMEFYQSDESFARHYSNPIVDDRHEQVIALLAGTPQRVDIRTVAFGFNTGKTDQDPMRGND